MNTESIRTFRRVLRRLEREIGWQLKSETMCCGVTVAQCHLILEIGNTQSCSLIDLANTLGLDSSTLSRNINNLVESGLVERVSNPDDRRYINLSLTTQGQKVFETIEVNCNQDYQDVFDLIPTEKQQQIIESFTLFTQALAAHRNAGQRCYSSDNNPGCQET